MSHDSNIPASEDGHDGTEVLDPFEIRVLAVLAEKEGLTPDSYPLSLNALTNGCNQLSSRDPVMAMSEEAVQDALLRLIQKRFVLEVRQAGARVVKYEHRMRIEWTLEQDKVAILTILMLRGVQTAGEIRARSGRLYEFASLADVEAGLQFLIDKFPPLAARLARAPGAKEVRYAHLLSGEDVLKQQELIGNIAPMHESRQDRVAHLENEVARLRSEIDALTEQFAKFRRQFE